MLHFNNLTKEDNHDVNEYFKLAELYFDKNKDSIVFQKFLSIFNRLCNENYKNIIVIDADVIDDKLCDKAS